LEPGSSDEFAAQSLEAVVRMLKEIQQQADMQPGNRFRKFSKPPVSLKTLLGIARPGNFDGVARNIGSAYF